MKHLLKLGLIDQVKAKWQIEGKQMAYPIKGIKLLRPPTADDREAFLLYKKQEEIGPAYEADDDDEAVDSEPEPAMEEVVIETALPNEDEIDPAPEVSVVHDSARFVPQWTTTVPMNNFLFNIIDKAGKDGLNSGQLAKHGVGTTWSRPLDETISRLTDAWEKSQPQHLRHLSIIRDTKPYGSRGVQYVYRSLAGHKQAVADKEATWEGISKTAAKSASALLKTSEIDQWGFPLPRASHFVDSSGNASMSKCYEAARIRAEFSSTDPVLVTQPDGTETVTWPTLDEDSEDGSKVNKERTPRKASSRPGRRSGGGMFEGVRTDSSEYQKLYRDMRRQEQAQAAWEAKARKLARWRAQQELSEKGFSAPVCDVDQVPSTESTTVPATAKAIYRKRGRPRKNKTAKATGGSASDAVILPEEDINPSSVSQPQTEPHATTTALPDISSTPDTVAISGPSQLGSANQKSEAASIMEKCISKHLKDVLSLRAPGAYYDHPSARRQNLLPYTTSLVLIVKSERLRDIDWTPKNTATDSAQPASEQSYEDPAALQEVEGVSEPMGSIGEPSTQSTTGMTNLQVDEVDGTESNFPTISSTVSNNHQPHLVSQEQSLSSPSRFGISFKKKRGRLRDGQQLSLIAVFRSARLQDILSQQKGSRSDLISRLVATDFGREESSRSLSSRDDRLSSRETGTTHNNQQTEDIDTSAVSDTRPERSAFKRRRATEPLGVTSAVEASPERPARKQKTTVEVVDEMETMSEARPYRSTRKRKRTVDTADEEANILEDRPEKLARKSKTTAEVTGAIASRPECDIRDDSATELPAIESARSPRNMDSAPIEELSRFTSHSISLGVEPARITEQQPQERQALSSGPSADGPSTGPDVSTNNVLIISDQETRSEPANIDGPTDGPIVDESAFNGMEKEQDDDLPIITEEKQSQKEDRLTSTYPSGRSKMRPKQGVHIGGGSVARVRSSILQDMLERCGGLMPGGTDLVQPFVAAFQARVANAPIPDRETIQRAVKNLRDQGTIKYFDFTLRGRNGRDEKKRIIALHTFKKDSKVIGELMKKMQAVHPHPYLAEAMWEPGTAPQARARVLLSGNSSGPRVPLKNDNATVAILQPSAGQMNQARLAAAKEEKRQKKAALQAERAERDAAKAALAAEKARQKAEEKAEREANRQLNDEQRQKRGKKRQLSDSADYGASRTPAPMTEQDRMVAWNGSYRPIQPAPPFQTFQVPPAQWQWSGGFSYGSTNTPSFSNYTTHGFATTQYQGEADVRNYAAVSHASHPVSGFGRLPPLAPRSSERAIANGTGSSSTPKSMPEPPTKHRRRRRRRADIDEDEEGTSAPNRAAKRQKTSRSYVSSPSDGLTPIKSTSQMTLDQLMMLFHAHIAVRVLASGLDGAVNWSIIDHVFRNDPTYNKQIFKSKWNTISKSRTALIEGVILDFQINFLKAYEAGEVPSINYDRMEETNWDAIVQWSIRTLAISSGSLPDLPRSQKTLGDSYELRERRVYLGKERARITKENIAELQRNQLIHELPLQLIHPSAEDALVALSLKDVNADILPRWHDLLRLGSVNDSRALVHNLTTSDRSLALMLAQSVIRADVFTTQDRHDPTQAQAKLELFSDRLIQDATRELERQRAITKVVREASKIRPPTSSRPHAMNAYFENALKGYCYVTIADLEDAASFKIKLDRTFSDGRKAVPFGFDASDGMNLATTNLNATGRIRMQSILPPIDNSIGISHQHISKWGWHAGSYKSSKTDLTSMEMIKLQIEPATTYEFGIPSSLRKGFSNPPPPPTLGDDNQLQLFPVWVDIHGGIMIDLWRKLVCYVLQTIHFRPYIGIEELTEAFKGLIWQWEIELLLSWAEGSGFAFGTDETGDDDKFLRRGWRAAEYWWLCLAKEVELDTAGRSTAETPMDDETAVASQQDAATIVD